MRVCVECKNEYIPQGRRQKYCGSIKNKVGCSHKIHEYRKTYDKNGIHRRYGWGAHADMLVNAVCELCGAKDKLELDHVIPRIIGGSDERENMRVLCQKCNRSRHHRLVRKALKLYFDAGFTE